MTGALGRLLPPAVPSAVGSVPHLDVAEAAGQALRVHPELPCAPQLPRRSAREAMLPQVGAGMPGVACAGDGRLVLDGGAVAATPADVPLDREAWAGTLGFLHAAAGARRTGPLKVQLAGPVTLGLALLSAGVTAGDALPLAAGTVAGRARALVSEAVAVVPGAPLVVVLDEPGLAGAARPGFPVDAGAVTDTLVMVLDAVHAEPGVAVAGVHCCAPTPWGPVVAAGAGLLSFPAGTVAGDTPLLVRFLDAGGWIAWGCVATDEPHREVDDETCWRRLVAAWDSLVLAGCDPQRLRHQAILTPDCGLARHQPDQVDPIYDRVRRLSARARVFPLRGAARAPASRSAGPLGPGAHVAPSG